MPIPLQIERLIRSAITAAQMAGALPAEVAVQDLTIPVSRSKRADQGHYAVACMALARPLQMKPLAIAETVAAHLPQDPILGQIDVAPPGFLNLHLSSTWLESQVHAVIEAGLTCFQQNMGEGHLVNVEFVSANPTGPVHVGRTRGAVVGDSIGLLMEACGWRVHREYYFNNGGRQMQMLGESLQIRYLQALGQAAELGPDHYQGEYLSDLAQQLVAEVGDSWRDKDWQAFKLRAEAHIFGMIRATMQRLGIQFDLYFNELDLYADGSVWKVRDDLSERGHTYVAAVREGASQEEIDEARTKNYAPATWFRSTRFGDDQDRVIVRSNGEPTYVLPDVAYHVNKIGRGFDRMIDVFGSDHFTEAQTVNRALQALGHRVDNIDVVLTQWVHLVQAGETVGMSTRRGQFVTLDDLLDEIGADAIRYFMLNRSTDSTINFDLDLAIKRSNENPVFYIQNAHVRCAGIFRQVESRGYPADWDGDADLTYLNDEERDFILKMLEFPEILRFAYETLSPHHIATWAQELARAFHPLYERSRVLHSEVSEDVAKARLRLYRATRIVFKRVLMLMGMSAPEEM
jgi:arginyl-tRNA synthetase